MADLKISALNSLAGADLVAADVVAVVDDSASETKKLTVSDLIANGSTLISDNTIPSAKILFSAGAIDTAELAASSVETAKINDSAVTAAKLADNSSVTLVSTLPASGDFTGQIALDTDDNKIYIWDGSAWDSVKGAGSINVVNGSTTGEINIVASTSGDTVTISATLDDTTAAAQFLGGPTGAGGTVGYRALVGTDLPTATTSAKGGVIVNGNGLTMSGDTITIDNTVTAEATENHIVQYDANGLVTGGRAIVAGDVPVATSTTTGVVKPGSGLGVDAAGEISHSNAVTGATAAKVTFDAQGHITATEALAASDIPDLDTDKITTGSFPTARIASDAVTADKLADRSTATISETTPAGGDFIGQCHLNSITGDYFLWDGNVWQPIGISVGEIVLAGTYDASTNLVATVTAEGTALSFVVGSALPAASSANKGYYVVVSEAGTGTSPAPTVALNPPDFLLSTGTAYTEIDVSSTVTAQQASNIAFTAAGNIAATNVQSAIEELDSEKVAATSPSLTGTVSIGTGGTIQFEGATANDFESTLTVVDPTADRTLSLPDVTGTLVSTGDTGTVTSTMITNGTIVNADISASAEIAVSKLGNGSARQVLQTDSLGTGVEFTDDLDLPGTLDVTGAARLDSTLAVTGATTTTGVINADGKVKFPAGSASAPSFYSGTDTNTGLYFSAADEISVATGGTQRVVVNSSGNVGIGRNTPTAKLALQTSSDDDIFQVIGYNFLKWNGGNQLHYGGYDSSQWGTLTFSTSGSERLRINSSGDVSIGTSSPNNYSNFTTLTLNGTTGGVIDFESSGTLVGELYNDASTVILTASTSKELSFRTNGQNERLRIDSSGSTSITSNVAVNGSELGSRTLKLEDSGTDDAMIYGDNSGSLSIQGGASQPGAGITLMGKSASSDPATIKFYTEDVSNDLSSFERMRIDSSGVVKLTQSGNNPRYGSLEVSGDAFRLKAFSGNASHNATMQFFTGADSPTERMRIDSSGNVGIGTTSPAADLHVAGDDIYVGSDAITRIRNDGSLAIISSTYTTGAGYKPLAFLTSDTERLRIDISGNIGIAESSPSTHSAGAGIPTFVLKGDNASYGDRSGALAFVSQDGTTGKTWLYHDTDFHIQSTTGTNTLFYTNNTERMRISSSGLVGIANTNPQTLLSLLGGYQIGWNHATDGTKYAEIYADTSSNLIFRNTNSQTERLRIDSSGNVGIGTSSPSALLDVAGNIVSGNTINSSSTVGGVSIYSVGAVYASYTGSNPVFVAKQNGSADTKAEIKADGSATFAGGATEIDGDGTITVTRSSATADLFQGYHSSTRNVLIEANGDATFAGAISDSIGDVRYLGTSSGGTGNYTLVAGDAGKQVRVNGGHTITIPNNVFGTGSMITIIAHSSSDVTIAQGSSMTLYNSADGSTGNRTLKARTVCTVLFAEGGASSIAYIAGGGIS